MALKDYGILKGIPTNYRNSKTSNNHYQIRIDTGDDAYRIAVNVRSKLMPRDLYYHIVPNFKHPILDVIQKYHFGFTPLRSNSTSGALDYLRGNLFQMDQMQVLPDVQDGHDNDLNDLFDFYIKKAIREKATVYAFGALWKTKSAKSRDKYFPETPDQGVHDIHMNQGNPANGGFAQDNGVWQDGGIMIHYPASGAWTAVFLRFQSQAVQTDDQTGFPDGELTVSSRAALQTVRILAALVNPEGEERGKEKVLLFNPTNQTVDLKEWALSNNSERKLALDFQLAPGATYVIDLPESYQLNNKGGIINLIDARSIKVDGVQYSKKEASKENEWVVF